MHPRASPAPPVHRTGGLDALGARREDLEKPGARVSGIRADDPSEDAISGSRQGNEHDPAFVAAHAVAVRREALDPDLDL
jgi:hypothetical protein